MTETVSASELKQALRLHLLKSFEDHDLKSWFDPLGIELSDTGREVMVAFPHMYFGQWFDAVRSAFEAQLGEFFGNGYLVRYQDLFNNSDPAPRRVYAGSTAQIDFPFDRQFLFETFLINKKNYFPLASAKEVAKQTGSLFNPFVICGGNGSGKTHLLKAVANDISKHAQVETILVTSVDELKNLYSGRFEGDVFKARNFVLEHEYLFLDDLQQLRKYPDLQPELIILFNHFFESKKQMVFSCQDKISSCEFLDPNLLSRLEWGLIVTLKQPDLEVRVQYIQQMARVKKLHLTKEQILTLAQRFKDFRYLQGILLKLFAFRELVRKDLSKKDFLHILSNTEEQTTETLTTETIIGTVADHFQVSVRDIKGNKRHAHIAQARQVSMYLCRKILSISFPALGRVFGNKDHSTVLYSVKKIEQLQEDDRELKQLLKDLRKKCLLYEEL